MKEFMGDDFLLNSPLAEKLFACVAGLPIIDYHCHLDPREIAENRRFKNITEMWLGGDHYKWRLMRANGAPEEYITGNKPDYEKFLKWAETVEDLIGSPLYHWTHLELKRYFGCELLLSAKTAPEIWERCNAVIAGGDFSVWGILDKFKVECLCTTDDPADDLAYHKVIAQSALKTRVLPAFRPSKALAVESAGFAEYINKLSGVSGIKIADYASLLDALRQRIDFFHQMGCRLSDNALDPPVFIDFTYDQVNQAFVKALRGERIGQDEANMYKTALFVDLGKKYSDLGWTMQMHMNASRNRNTAMYNRLGADCGYDSILDVPVAEPVCKLLDSLAVEGKLPKTILYNLNPSADDVLTTVIGNFQGGSKGKMQFGSAWWFNDSKTGMIKQMTALANNGLLARFVGMLTDSRSFLSYTRHEYFRRIMCNLLAEWVTNGEFPDEFGKLSEIASGIAYNNAKEYFEF